MRRITLMAVVALAAVTMSGCGSTVHVTKSLRAEPSVSISAPLSTVACDGADSCFAIGTTGLDGSPDAAGQVSAMGGSWTPMTLPSGSDTVISAASCWHGGCLFGGNDAGADAIWRVQSSSGQLTPAPLNGSGVIAMSCYSSLSCVITDHDENGNVRFSTTADGGDTWTSPPAPQGLGAIPISGLSCQNSSSCVVIEPYGDTTVAVLVDPSNGTVTSHTSIAHLHPVDINCRDENCTMLGRDHGAGVVVTSSDNGQSWTRPHRNVFTGRSHPSFLACTTTTCVALLTRAGQSEIAVQATTSWRTEKVRYAPTPFTSLSCGTRWCAAIDATAAISVRP